MSEWEPKQKFNVPAPRNASERSLLCGVALKEIEPYWDSSAAADAHATFFIAGQTIAREDTVRLWDIFRTVTGKDPDTTPQPTGNCVAAASDDVMELLQATQIFQGERQEFRDIHSSYHYATGRVIIGKNRLRGGAGSIGGWQAAAHKQFGVTEMGLPGLPAYTKRNVDAWGDDREAEGKSFRDFMKPAKERLVKSTARVQSMDQIFDALSNGHPLTIASNRGYSMKPRRDGYHRPSGRWSHQMSLWGYSVSKDWIAIKNQWGRAAHGTLKDFETGEPWPPGFLRVRLSDFETKHLRGSETIAYSRFEGFPEQRFDHGVLG